MNIGGYATPNDFKNQTFHAYATAADLTPTPVASATTVKAAVAAQELIASLPDLTIYKTRELLKDKPEGSWFLRTTSPKNPEGGTLSGIVLCVKTKYYQQNNQVMQWLYEDKEIDVIASFIKQIKEKTIGDFPGLVTGFPKGDARFRAKLLGNCVANDIRAHFNKK